MSWSPERSVSLAKLTTWKIGGAAEWFVAPESEEALTRALSWAGAQSLPWRVIGRGSNLLIADEGLPGLTICLRSYETDHAVFNREDDGKASLEVSCGMSLPRLAKLAARHGYAGYEFYIGIPGTVGGAVVMNAGFGPGDERQTANRCAEIRVLDGAGETHWMPYTAVRPAYRHTELVDRPSVVLQARFRLLESSSPEAIRAVTAEHLSMRKERQPLTRPTAGSVFKGTAEGVPAAVYIDRCGLKGFQAGQAIVSLKHANWIENLGGATAQDVLDVIEHVIAVVEEKEGIRLETEVRYLH